MIKGINRQVVEVRETDSEYFERILFFVKPEYASVSEGKIRERASLIANKGQKPPATRLSEGKYSELMKGIICLAAGAIIGALAMWFLK